MEKETILSTLTEKLGDTQLSERTLTAYIDSHPVADGAEPDEAYFTAATTFLQSLEGQYKHDVAEGIKKGGTPPPKGTQTPPGNEADNKELKELRDKVAALEKDRTSREQAETQAALVKKVKAAMKEQNATDDYVLNQTFKGVMLDPAKSVGDLVAEMLTKYDSEYKACRGDGASPRQNKEGGGGGKTETMVDRFFARKKKREGGWSQNK